MNNDNKSMPFLDYSEYLSYQVDKCITPVNHPYYQGVRDSHFKIVKMFLSDIKRDSAILDCGCGYGFALDAFHKCNFLNVIGIDISEHRQKFAREIGYPIFNVDMHDMSEFDNDQFDVVYSSHTLEHALYPENVINEIHRVLKPFGIFILVLPYPVLIKDEHTRKAHCGSEFLNLTRVDDGMMLIQTIEHFGFSLKRKSVGSYRDESEIYLKFTKGSSGSNIKVVKHGAMSTKTCTPFNVQPNGNSALWFKIEDPYQSDLVVEFDGLYLKTARTDDILTAEVPDSLLQTPGRVIVRIIDVIKTKRCTFLGFHITGDPHEQNNQKHPNQRNSPPIPNFFLIGAPRSGTTSMYWRLRAHSEVHMSRTKEPFFFDERAHGVLSESVSKESEYLALFKFAPFQVKIIGEASTSYLSSVKALKKISRYNPDSNILIMLRNPIKASISMYLQTRKGGKYEFEPNFEQAWRACYVQADRLFMINYPKLFLIGEQLKNAYSIFNNDKIKVVIFDDLVQDSASVFSDVLHFLGLDAHTHARIPRSNSAEWKNMSSVASNHLIKEMIEYFRPQVEMVSSHLHRNLDHWLIP
ncbi:MAG: methyltransferase domain-containing protein [Nitrospinales bacterium]